MCSGRLAPCVFCQGEAGEADALRGIENDKPSLLRKTGSEPGIAGPAQMRRIRFTGLPDTANERRRSKASGRQEFLIEYLSDTGFPWIWKIDELYDRGG